MPDAPSPAEDPVVEDSREDATKRVVEGVVILAHEHLDKLVKSRKFLKAATYFPSYNCAQEFIRGTNDISSVSVFSQSSLIEIFY